MKTRSRLRRLLEWLQEFMKLEINLRMIKMQSEQESMKKRWRGCEKRRKSEKKELCRFTRKSLRRKDKNSWKKLDLLRN